MALTKETIQDKIEILEDGTMQVRTCTRIIEDGVVLSRSYHRHVVTPGADVTNETDKIKALASTVHTDEVKTAYAAKLAAQQAGNV